MKTIHETLAQEVIPSLRALLAMKLTTTHSLSQTEAAKRMGLSQPAISQYLKSLRGLKTTVITGHPKLSEDLEKLAANTASGALSPEQQTREIETFCQQIISLDVLKAFCE